MVIEKLFSWEEDFDLRPGKSLIKYLRMVSKEIGDFKDDNDDCRGGCGDNNYNSHIVAVLFIMMMMLLHYHQSLIPLNIIINRQ